MLTEVRNLWKVVTHDVRLIRMMSGVVLMIILSRVKRTAADLGYDRTSKHICLVELVNVGARDTLLIFVCVKDGRAILCPGVGSLPIKLRGIMGDRKEYFE